jgi:hypothetical protein
LSTIAILIGSGGSDCENFWIQDFDKPAELSSYLKKSLV